MNTKQNVKQGKVTTTAAIAELKAAGATDCPTYRWLLNRAAKEKNVVVQPAPVPVAKPTVASKVLKGVSAVKKVLAGKSR